MTRKLLRALAVLVALSATGLWLAKGANRGWTKDSVPVKTREDVTGIEGISYEKRFVPGVDFLAAALVGSIILAGVSFLFRNRQTQQT